MIDAEAREARRIGSAMAEALAALAGFHGAEGCFPSHATVAEAAGVSLRTVRDAIQRAEEAGYLKVTPRYRLTNVRGRSLRVRDTSAYEFLMPATAVPGRAEGLAWRAEWWARLKTRRAAKGGPSGRVPPVEPASLRDDSSSVPAPIIDRTAALAALAARQAAVQAMLAGGKHHHAR